MAKPFDEWLNSRYSAPVDILLEDIIALSHKASDCNALINEEILTKLDGSYFSGNGKKFYLPNLRKVNDSKQYAVIRMGKTGENVDIPIVIFRSYRTSFEGKAVYSPARYLWRKFREEKENFTAPTNSQTSYNESLAQLKAMQESLAAEQQETRAAAYDAAQVATRRLYKKSNPISSLPSILKQKGITHHIPDEARICHSTVSSKVYFSTKDEWKDAIIAYPRDILIPIYNAEFKDIINVQIISAQNPSRKRFIPGGPTQTLSLPLSHMVNKGTDEIPSIRIVLEGYRTAKAAQFLHVQSSLGLPVQFFVAFSASNIPLALSNIEKAYGPAITFTAFDHDAEHSDYAKQSEAQQATSISAPTHKHNADWADVLQDLPLEQAITVWEQHLIDAVKRANQNVMERKISA